MKNIQIGEHVIVGEPVRGLEAMNLALDLTDILGPRLMQIIRRAMAARAAQRDGADVNVVDHALEGMELDEIVEAVAGTMGDPAMRAWVAKALKGWQGVDKLGAWATIEAAILAGREAGLFTPPPGFARIKSIAAAAGKRSASPTARG